MITAQDNNFRLDTENTTYLFRITKFGHLEHIYYGSSLGQNEPANVLAQKRTVPYGNGVVYDESDPRYCLDNMFLEWSDNGRGDYRQSPTELIMPDGSFVSDFVYTSHRVIEGSLPMKELPTAYGGDQTLVIDLQDTIYPITISLYFTVFEKANVITRRAKLTNASPNTIFIRRMMSMMVDLPNENFHMLTLDGAWIKESHLHNRTVEYGMTVNSSVTGASSNRHNPGFMLAQENATEDNGHVYGFNLIYSGNHYSSVEKNWCDIVRVSLGINPHCFSWKLSHGESFETPEAVFTYSAHGFNELSHNMHMFVNNHIVRGIWKNRERPVLINSWEAYFFDFNEKKLLDLAQEAKELGVELFVLDDGWFGERNNDRAGLGDYTVNTNKLPHGMKAFADKIHALGLKFGLWFEPEMVNPDSSLFRTHPEYAVTLPGREPVYGRNQLVLDLCNSEVRDYIVEHMGAILDEAKIDYVKWDMNRHIAEGYSTSIKNQGEFYHRYIIGLYDVLTRIFHPRPHILLESCSSGGNRFDLGMLCFSPQIWGSDNTDPVERLKIQTGLSYFYPLSTIGTHVSQSPNQQTLRDTPLSTRFNVACFGCMGYELDLKSLTADEKKDLAEQILFYKKYRQLFQYGTFSRIKTNKPNTIIWQSVSSDKNTAISGFFQTLSIAAATGDKLVVTGLNPGRFRVHTKLQRLYRKRFGALIKYLPDSNLDAASQNINHPESFPDCMEEYECTSTALRVGIPLCNQYLGTGFDKNVRMMGDFGSNLYIIESADALRGHCRSTAYPAQTDSALYTQAQW
ncbi:MAG: Alpha-galactosidase [Oscillospiraceae bacterium]